MHLHLDCFAGIAGDMLLGALVDLGVSKEAIVAELEKLDVDGWTVSFTKRDAGHNMVGVGVDVGSDELSSVHRGDLDENEAFDTAAYDSLDVESAEGDDRPDSLDDTQEHDPVVLDEAARARVEEGDFDPSQTLEWHDVAVEAHLHDHDHDHGHGHGHEHGDTRANAAVGGHHHGPHRSYAEIVALIDEAELSERATSYAQSVFRRIAEAEARVHGMSVDDVHFHEVGGIDSIVDIVGAAVALDLLDVDSVSATPVPLGRGFTDSQHGTIPIPAPATLECLRNVPCFDSGLDVELVTPTGAGFIGALATRFARFPEMTIEGIGYGAGNRRHADRPNLLRAVLGTRDVAASVERDEVWSIAANIDDQSAESLASALEALWEAGAIDVWSVPVVMKKGRLGQQVEALAPVHKREDVVEAFLRHSTTLGVRVARYERTTLSRSLERVETRFGSVAVKVARGLDGSVWNVAPEADDCAEVARREQVPVKLVYQAALAKGVELE